MSYIIMQLKTCSMASVSNISASLVNQLLEEVAGRA